MTQKGIHKLSKCMRILSTSAKYKRNNRTSKFSNVRILSLLLIYQRDRYFSFPSHISNKYTHWIDAKVKCTYMNVFHIIQACNACVVSFFFYHACKWPRFIYVKFVNNCVTCVMGRSKGYSVVIRDTYFLHVFGWTWSNGLPW